MEEEKYKCVNCAKQFSNNSNLKRHLKRFHNLTTVKRDKNYKFSCEKCPRNFNNAHHLRFHLKKNHGQWDKTVKKNLIHCPVSCAYKTSSTKECLLHFVQTHNIDLEYEELKFPDRDAFLEWKNLTEKSTKSKFVTNKSFASKNHTTIKYACHRSGHYISESKGKRQLKTQGSNKIGGFCPAGLTVIVGKDCDYSVKYLKTHVGHEAELGHLCLTSDERQSIADKIASKIPFGDILDEIKNSVGDSTMERVHLLTKKDLYNIASSFNLQSSSVRHSNDAWAKEMQRTGVVLFYKPQHQKCQEHKFLKTEDFVLIIMTEAQSEILLKYGSDCICVDRTHGVNGYGFELHTVLVREGFPCAFMISNRGDQEVFALFFSCLKKKIGLISPNIFMSDLGESFYHSWINIMNIPQHRFFCSWHIDNDWRKNLSKIKTKDKQVEIYKQMRTLLEETDPNTFSLMLQHIMEHLQCDPDLEQFFNYFSEHYERKTELWAYCYRIHLGINTNRHLEGMHKTLKCVFLNKEYAKRLDKAVHAIMNLIRDKLFDQLSVMHKEKICSKLKDIQKRHQSSLKLDVTPVATENGWTIETYNIQECDVTCNCQLNCTECNICIHRYRCSCIDSAIKWNMCKHIHYLAQYRQPLHQEDIKDAVEDEILFVHVEERNNHQDSLNNEKMSFTSRKNKLLDDFNEMLEKATTVEDLDVIEKAIAPLPARLVAAQAFNSS